MWCVCVRLSHDANKRLTPISLLYPFVPLLVWRTFKYKDGNCEGGTHHRRCALIMCHTLCFEWFMWVNVRRCATRPIVLVVVLWRWDQNIGDDAPRERERPSARKVISGGLKCRFWCCWVSCVVWAIYANRLGCKSRLFMNEICYKERNSLKTSISVALHLNECAASRYWHPSMLKGTIVRALFRTVFCPSHHQQLFIHVCSRNAHHI